MPITGGGGTGGGTGPQGADGESAYQLAVDNGFLGTQTDWLASLVGPKGDPGDPGSATVNGLAIDAPLHPLAYRVAGTRAGDLSPTNIGGLVGISNGTDTGSNTHRLVTFPYAVGRVGVVVGNFYVNDPSTGRDTISGLSPVVCTTAIGDTGSTSQPVPGFGLAYFATSTGLGKMLSGDDTSVTIQPGDAAVFDMGVSADAGASKFINLFADVTASGAGAKFPVMGTKPLTTTGDRAATSAGEVDKTLYTPSTSIGGGTAGHGFDFLAVIDLQKLNAGAPWQACLVVGDSLNGGDYGTQQALAASPVPFAQIARGQEQLAEFLQFNTAKSLYRRSVSSQMVASFAFVQYLTNDAALSDGQTFAPSGTPEGAAWKRSWQVKQRDLLRWLNRRGITRVAWATVPPNTDSTDSWVTLSHQFLNMASGQRGPRQQLMQDWNNYLRTGTLLYADPAGWRLYAPPSGQGFGAGSVIADVWAPLTVMEPVDTTAVPTGTAGYDFGGQPIMKWALPTGVAATTEGLHPGTTAGTNVHAAGVTGVFNYMKANG